MSKTVFIKTYGCQMNVYDSARMADALASSGFSEVSGPDQADLVVLNTCHIREHASEKVFSELGRLRRLKSERALEGGRLTIAVAGCVAQAEGETILSRAPYVDIVLGPQTYHRLPEMVAKVTAEGCRVLDTEFPVETKFDHLPSAGAHGASAFLAVQEGCDKFCTFCVVPYTRGAEYSRTPGAIVDEARILVEQGVREITLLGQNVNGYHGTDDGENPGTGLARLIERLAALPGLSRIRYTTSHPCDMDDALIAAHRDIPALMPFLHLPVQSGSDRVLAAMNRHHDAALYRGLVDKLRKARPDLALSSDFIVGFPGETDDDFEATLALIRDVRFAQAYSFKYSPRPGTPAAAMDGQVPEPVKEDRLARLQALLAVQAADFNKNCLGRSFDVLLERPGRKSGQLIGRSPYMQAVHVTAPESLMNTVQPLCIKAAHVNSLTGELTAQAGEAA